MILFYFSIGNELDAYIAYILFETESVVCIPVEKTNHCLYNIKGKAFL